jgi:hypothetical protein
LAIRRASSALSALGTPSVMRRCLPPMVYWKIHRLDPPRRSLTPKPGTPLSNAILSALPSGSTRARTDASVSFMAILDLGSLWEWT